MGLDGHGRYGHPFWDGWLYDGANAGLSLGGVQMTSQPYKTRSGKIGRLPVFADTQEFMSYSADQSGWCLACGGLAYGVEQDARRYECECCGGKSVYGLEELLIMDMVRFDAEGDAK